MNDLDGPIDQLLRAAGDRWRAARDVSGRHVDPALFASTAAPRPTARGFFVSLAGATAVVAVLLILAVIMPPADNRGVLPTGSASPPPASPPPASPLATPPAGEARLEVVGGGDTTCLSIGGCAAYFGIEGIDPASEATEWRFEWPAADDVRLLLPDDAPSTIDPGHYTLRAHLDWVSDVIVNNEPPDHGPVASCENDLTVDPSAVGVRVDVIFHGSDPCEIEIQTVSRDPSLPVVHDGDHVVGTGQIVAWGGRGPELCTETPSRLMDSIVRCSPIAVDVDVAEVADLPGWRPQEGGGYSGWLRVRGTWIHGALHVDRVVEIEEPGHVFPLSPCDAPAGGWPGDLPNTLDGENLSRHLQEVVDAEPFSFSGVAPADLPLGQHSKGVLVVGTVGDLEEVRDRLTAIYPYNLCVIQVEYSASELEPVRDRLFRPEDGTWQTSIDVIAGRVVLKLAVLDDDALAAVGDDVDKIVFQPLIELDQTPEDSGSANPGRPYTAADVLEKMQSVRAPVPPTLERAEVAEQIAANIWTFDGRPYDRWYIDMSCNEGGRRCGVSVTGELELDAAGTDTYDFAVDMMAISVTLLSADDPELAGFPAELRAELEQVARSLVTEPSLDGLYYVRASWFPPPHFGQFLLHFDERNMEGSRAVDVWLDLTNHQVLDTREYTL